MPTERKNHPCEMCGETIKRFDCELKKKPYCFRCSCKIYKRGKPFKLGHTINLGRKHSRINNNNCCGKVQVHHILSWREYPELRYEINNGITLCQAHHPRKRAEEKRLICKFQKLVSVSIGNI